MTKQTKLAFCWQTQWRSQRPLSMVLAETKMELKGEGPLPLRGHKITRNKNRSVSGKFDNTLATGTLQGQIM